MEVIKYYCEICGKEIEKGDWTEILIAVREYPPPYGRLRETITHSKKMCDSCLDDLGLAKANKEDTKEKLKATNIFAWIIKSLVKKTSGVKTFIVGDNKDFS